MIQIKQFQPTSHKIKALVYGASGSGKTTFAGTAKNAIFASAEGGLLSIADKLPNYVEIKSLQDLKDLHLYLKTQPHNFETVVIDSITEINDIIKSDIEKRTGKAMQLQDWGTLAKDIKTILRNFRDLPMHVLFIAQEMVDEKDENGTASKVVPSLNGKASTEIAYFMDIVGYVYITKTGDHKVITGSNARLLTKDRSGQIGNDTTADFSVWCDKVANITMVETESVVDTFETPEQQPAGLANVPQANKLNPPVRPAQNQGVIGNATAQTKQPVGKVDVYKMAKTGLTKVTTLKGAENGLAKVKTVAGLTDEQRAELTTEYTALVAKLSPVSAGDNELPTIE